MSDYIIADSVSDFVIEEEEESEEEEEEEEEEEGIEAEVMPHGPAAITRS